MSFGEAKTIVAESANSQANTDFLTRAGRSLRAAIRRWNTALNWDWTKVVDTSITASSATATYALPYNIKAIYDVRLGNRPLRYADRRIYDRLTTDQTAARTVSYDLFRKGTQGLIELLPPTTETETLTLKYYRLLTEPCTVTGLACTAQSTSSGLVTCGTVTGITIGSQATFDSKFTAAVTVTAINSGTSFSVDASPTATGACTGTIGGDGIPLDIPTQYVDGVLAMATHNFLGNKAGGMDSPRLQYWYGESDRLLNEAIRNNNYNPDEELVFIPSYVADSYVDNTDNPQIKDWIGW